MEGTAETPSPDDPGSQGQSSDPADRTDRTDRVDRTEPTDTASMGLSLPGVGEHRRRRLPPVGQRLAAVRRPTALGYVQLHPGPNAVATGMAQLEAFARAQGWALGEVFVDDDPGRPLGAWESLLASARERRPAAVVIPDLDGLCPEPLSVDALRTQLTTDLGVPLVVAATIHSSL